MNLLHQGLEILGAIDMLVHALQRVARYRFESDAQHRAAALGGKLEHAVIIRKLGGNAGLPSNAAPLQGSHNLFWTFGGTKEVGIIHRDGTRATVLHFMDNFIDRAVSKL